MDRFRTLEEKSGVGSLMHGDEIVVADVRYALRVRQRMLLAKSQSGSSEIPGMKSADARIIPSSAWALAPLVAEGKLLDLVLEDGRKLPCYVASTSGELAVAGDFR